MTKPTGSPNLEGLLGGLDEVVGIVGKLFNVADGDFTHTRVDFDPDLGKTADSGKEQAEPDTRLVKVKDLRLGDRVVLEDGAWGVTGLNLDGFSTDRVEVTLANGESYDMLTFAYVDVEN